jgi:hypothetical protein
MTRALILRAAGGALVALVGCADGASAGALMVTTPRVTIRPPTPHLQVNSYAPRATYVTTDGRGIVAAGSRNGTSATFQLNPTNGTVQFGNGAAGQTPPAGTNNVTASYRTGGGGNGGGHHRR